MGALRAQPLAARLELKPKDPVTPLILALCGSADIGGLRGNHVEKGLRGIWQNVFLPDEFKLLWLLTSMTSSLPAVLQILPTAGQILQTPPTSTTQSLLANISDVNTSRRTTSSCRRRRIHLFMFDKARALPSLALKTLGGLFLSPRWRVIVRTICSCGFRGAVRSDLRVTRVPQAQYFGNDGTIKGKEQRTGCAVQKNHGS